MTTNEPAPYVKVLTDAEIQALADEARRDYDGEHSPRSRKPPRRGETYPCGEPAPHQMHLWMWGNNPLFCKGEGEPAPPAP